VRLLQRGRRMPRAKTIRPAEPYLAAAAEMARQLGHNNIGTEHVLSMLIRNPDSPALRVLARSGILRRCGKARCDREAGHALRA
jgi:ATP-dependent Clp protease ATP-binding subunit ClpA